MVRDIILAAGLLGFIVYIFMLTRSDRSRQLAPRNVPDGSVDMQGVLKVFSAYREYMTHEGSLINFRMTWLLTINGFLFATTGLLVQKRVDIVRDFSAHDELGVKFISQIDWLLMGVFFVGFMVSFLAAHSIRDAKIVARTLEFHFRNSYPVKEDTGLRYILVGNGPVRLPLIAGGGMPRGNALGSYASTFIPWALCLTWYIAFWLLGSPVFST